MGLLHSQHVIKPLNTNQYTFIFSTTFQGFDYISSAWEKKIGNDWHERPKQVL